MFIDVDALRLDLIKYFGTAMQSNSVAMVDLIRVQNADDYEIVNIAVKNGFNLDNYEIKSNDKTR